MPAFRYVARTRQGATLDELAEAASPAALVGELRARGLFVLEVREDASASGGAADALLALSPAVWLPIRSLDVELSLQQLAVMIRSGLTLLAGLKTLAEHSTRRRMGLVWEDVAERIQAGSSLSDSMGLHRCFPHLVVQLVRVGEQTGMLEPVLVRATEALERRRMLKASLATALMYPAIVLVAAIGVTIFMIVSVLPKLQRFLSALGRKLPPMTQNLIDISVFFQTHGIAILVAVVAAAIAFAAVCMWPAGRRAVDRMLLRIPVIGQILRVSGTISFSNVLGTLLRSGITLTEALRTLELLMGNRHLADRVAAARSEILRGGSLHRPLGERHGFMPMLSRMAAVGETSGTLEEVMEEVARFHETQLQGIIRRFSAIIEPIIILTVGSIVGYVYIAFFMALFAAGGPR